MQAGEVHSQRPALLAFEETVGGDLLDEDVFDLELSGQPLGFPDPWEDANRGILGFNRGLDRLIFEPITRGYRTLIPDPARAAIRRAFTNTSSVAVLLNETLQLELRCAGITAVRFVTNTTVGLAGLFDPAAAMGLQSHEADFGQTLARAGVGSGPYLVLPLFGPSTARDGMGTVMDAVVNPAFWLLGPVEQLTYGGGAGLTARDAYYEAMKALEASSVDYYAALRNGYYQRRSAHLEGPPGCEHTVRSEPVRRRGGATWQCWPTGRRLCR